MQATAETLEGNRVKLSVEVPPEEFSQAFDAALAEVAATIRMPGFRPGRVPKKVVEARIGRDVLRQEALNDSIPGYVRRAAVENGVDAIGAPEVEVTSTPEEAMLRFDAVVETRPRPTIPGYAGLRVTLPSPQVSDAEIDAQVDRMRDQFGELNVVARPARHGDHATVNIKGSRNGEPVDALSVDDFVYEIGSGGMVEGLDDHLVSAKAGDIFTFETALPPTGEEVSLQVLVKEVKEKVLPDADDTWASEASEFATLAELRADIAERIGGAKRAQLRMALRGEAAKELSALVTEDLPEVLIAEEMQIRLQDLQGRLDMMRSTLGQYLAATGQDAQGFTDGLREAAADTVRLDLALRSLAEAESIQATDAEVDERIDALAQRTGGSAESVRRRIEEVEGLDAIAVEIRKAKALDWLEEHVEIVDEDGKLVDRALLEAGEQAEDDPSPDEGETADPAPPEALTGVEAAAGGTLPGEAAEPSTLEE